MNPTEPRFPVFNRINWSFEAGRLLDMRGGTHEIYECVVLFANTIEDLIARGHTFNNAADIACNEMQKNEDLEHFWGLLLNSVYSLRQHWVRAEELESWYWIRTFGGKEAMEDTPFHEDEYDIRIG